MKAFIPVMACLLVASPMADAAGDNTVLLSVVAVTVPAKLPGACQVHGDIQHVFQGRAFHAGQAIVIKVPCDSGAARLVPAVAVITGPDNVHVTAAPILKQSRQGLARLDDAGALIWQAGSNAGRYGPAWGYRVVDGMEMPAN